MEALEYCVAIRTLGTAGEKYQTLLDSLNKQTIRPKKIFVYIPYGYEIPKETIGWEEYVRCPKGMITQRSLPFNEIDTKYILFCDDDISLEPSSVENLFRGLIENDGDCISPNTFPVEKMSTIGKIKKAIAGYAFPRRNDGWAFKVMRNGSYTYNNHPGADVLPSESAAFPCVLIKRKAYDAIHFEDERWMEDFGYALGDDLLFYYKLFVMGYKVLVHYNSGILHLDAGTSSRKYSKEWTQNNVALSLVVSYRIKFKLKDATLFDRILWLFSFCMRFLEQWMFAIIKELVKNHRLKLLEFPKGLVLGYRYIRSDCYRNTPSFDTYK